MTHPGTTPDDTGQAGLPPSESAGWAQAQLDRDGVRRLAGYLRRVRSAAFGLCIVVLVIGLVGLGLGLAAWGASTAGIVLVAVFSIPAVIGSTMALLRLGALAKAIAHPDQVVDQARDLVDRLRTSPELDQLVATLRRSKEPGGPVTEVGRVRKGIRTMKLGSEVIGQAEPDPSAHRLLVPFTPSRLGSLWRWIGVTLWGWLISVVLMVAALAALGLRQL